MLSLDVFKRRSLFVSCAKVSRQPVYTVRTKGRRYSATPANNDNATFSVWLTRRHVTLSSLQDRSVRVWQMDDGGVRCVARGLSHTNAVGSITCSR